MATIRLTMGQAVVNYLANQHVERDGVENRFFAGLWGIFGHGNIGGVAQAVQQHGPELPYYLSRNEQAMVHAAVGFAKLANRLRAFACLSSIGPGATNMVTGAASATINHVPVLLLAGDMFAERVQSPVLQQLEVESSQAVSVNDTFRPVVRYWDRIERPEQVITALPEVMRVLTSPADTGAVLLALPQDIQTYAFDYPVEMFEKRTWSIPRNRPDARHLAAAARLIRESSRPVIFAGGGVRYSDAMDALRAFAEQTGIPVAETHAGQGLDAVRPPAEPRRRGRLGEPGGERHRARTPTSSSASGRASPTSRPRRRPRSSTRTCASSTSTSPRWTPSSTPRCPSSATLAPRSRSSRSPSATTGRSDDYQARVRQLNLEWDGEVERVYAHSVGDVLTQGEVIGAVEASADPRDVVVTSAGSLPGDLLKLWRAADPASYQVEYGYSTMGYEIAGGLGAKMAAPDREVYVMVGDGSFLMMSSEITTAVQEGIKLVIVVVDNKGFSSVGRVSEQVGAEGFGCHYRLRGPSGQYDGEEIKVDFVKICEGLGARALEVTTLAELRGALQDARRGTETVCIVVQTDWHERVRGYAASWWEMATPQVSTMPAVVAAREEFDRNKGRQRYLMVPGAPYQSRRTEG